MFLTYTCTCTLPSQMKLKLLRFVTRLFTKAAPKPMTNTVKKGKEEKQEDDCGEQEGREQEKEKKPKTRKRNRRSVMNRFAAIPIGIRSAYSLEDTFMRIVTNFVCGPSGRRWGKLSPLGRRNPSTTSLAGQAKSSSCFGKAPRRRAIGGNGRLKAKTKKIFVLKSPCWLT